MSVYVRTARVVRGIVAVEVEGGVGVGIRDWDRDRNERRGVGGEGGKERGTREGKGGVSEVCGRTRSSSLGLRGGGMLEKVGRGKVLCEWNEMDVSGGKKEGNESMGVVE